MSKASSTQITSALCKGSVLDFTTWVTRLWVLARLSIVFRGCLVCDVITKSVAITLLLVEVSCRCG